MTELDRYYHDLLALLDSPAPVLNIVGRLSPALQTLLVDTNPRYHDDVEHCLNAEQGSASPSALMMIQADAIDGLPNLLGPLCQRFPNQVLIELQHDPNDKTAAHQLKQACFALGFRHALHLVSDDVEYQLYEYRLKNYKQAPDWLNSRFWAHPERFNTP